MGNITISPQCQYRHYETGSGLTTLHLSKNIYYTQPWEAINDRSFSSKQYSQQRSLYNYPEVTLLAPAT